MKKSMQNIQGSVQLAFDSIEGVTNRVEKMHATIAEQPLPWSQDSQSTSHDHSPAHGNIAASV